MKNEFEPKSFEPGQISSSQLRISRHSQFSWQIKQYSGPTRTTFESAKTDAIEKLSKQLGIDVHAFNQTDHNLMDKLIANGLLDVAREFAQHPDKFRSSHRDIVDLTEQMVQLINVNTFGPTKDEEKLVKQLNQLIQSTFSQ